MTRQVCKHCMSIHHTFQTHLLHFISHSLTDLWTSHVQTLLALKADSRPSSLPQSRRKWRSPQDSKKRERESRMLRTYEPKAKEAFAVKEFIFKKRHQSPMTWRNSILFTTGKKLFYDSSKRFRKPEKRLVKYWVLGKSDQELNDLSSY